MQKQLAISGKKLFSIGIGTWGIGGLAKRDLQNDDAKQIAAMEYALKQGLNYVEVNMWSAEGHSAYIFTEAL